MRGGQRSVLVLAALVAAAVVVSVLRTTGAGAALEGLALGALAPLRAGLTSVSSGAAAVVTDAQQIEVIRAENEALRAEVAALRLSVTELEAARRDNAALRAALSYQQDNPELALLTARVVGRDSVDALDTVIIDRGAEQGVRSGMALIAEGSLAGRVERVTSTSADVRPIHSAHSAVNVFAQGEGGTTDGIVEGDGAGGLTLTRVEPDAPLAIGDIVITSGLGGGFPRGLPVGRVVSVLTSPASVFRQAVIDPFARAERLGLVHVVLGRRAGAA